MIIGYARVSTDDQKLDAQTDALSGAGAERIFADRISGASRKRPELDRLLDQLRTGDVVVVAKYDRLARSLRDLGQTSSFRLCAEVAIRTVRTNLVVRFPQRSQWSPLRSGFVCADRIAGRTARASFRCC